MRRTRPHQRKAVDVKYHAAHLRAGGTPPPLRALPCGCTCTCAGAARCALPAHHAAQHAAQLGPSVGDRSALVGWPSRA